MKEYIPCYLVREELPFTYIVEGSGSGWCKLRNAYSKRVVPCNMDHDVKLGNQKKTLLPGPFNASKLPQWARNFISKVNEGKS